MGKCSQQAMWQELIDKFKDVNTSLPCWAPKNSATFCQNNVTQRPMQETFLLKPRTVTQRL